MKLSSEEQKKQELYRDARITGKYDDIWQNVGFCSFCKLNDSYVYLEENDVVMTVALYAYIDGHSMIIPRRHVLSAKELTPLEWETMRKFMYIAKKLIREEYEIKGVQYILREGTGAQGTVDHLHYHCMPFDAPDLSMWNYRKLKYTPIENVQKYRKHAEKMKKLGKRFEKKYKDDKTK